MEIPDKVKFLSHEYTVNKVPGFHNNKTGTNPDRDRGRIEYLTGVINIDPELFDHLQTFFHEAQHMIANHMGVDLDEKDTDRLAEGWLHFLKENNLLK